MPATHPVRPITLYRYTLSGHCHRVELFLRLLGLPWQPIDVDLRRDEHKQPEFLALNVFGQVPVIDDAGTIVSDSNAILTYLALRYADESWLPRDAIGAARVQRWLSAAAGPLAFGAARARVVQLFGLPQDPQDAIDRAHSLCKVIEHTLAGDGSPFIAGERPTIADVALYTYTAHAPEGNVSLDAYRVLRAWLHRIEALPGFVAMPTSRIGLAA
jgi:glutathione S-transferase